MAEFSLKKALADKKLTIGSWLTLADTDVCEMMSRAGFDWLAIDQEHSSIGLREMSRLVQVIDLAGCLALVRVGANDPLLIKHALESGAAGVIVPMVNSVKDARAAVEAAHYPPLGKRGVGLYRAQGYGAAFQDYRNVTSKETVVIAQIERCDGIDDLEAIMAVEGVDAMMIGPYDLSESYGKSGDFTSPEMLAALGRVSTYAKNGTKACGIHAVNNAGDDLPQRIEEGYTFIVYGTDMIFLHEKISAERGRISGILNQGKN